MDYIAERENGDYVKYEDHIAALTTAERERDEARRERDEAMGAVRHFRNAEAALRAGFHRNALTADAAVVDGLVKQCKELGHRAERAERVVEAAKAWVADLWRGDLNGTVIGVCMEYEPDGQYVLWEQVAPIVEAVRALDAAEGNKG